MKTGSILAATTMMFGLTHVQGATLAQKWNISEDASFEYESLSFKLGFTVSDFIFNDPNDNNIDMTRFELYDDRCRGEGVPQLLAGAGNGIKSIVEDDAEIYFDAESGDNMDRTVYINITLDSETISGNPLIYSEDTSTSQVTAEIRFCLRFGLYTRTGDIEVNFLETLITLNVDLTDGFQIGSIAVEPRDRLVRTANQVYNVEGFLCIEDENNAGQYVERPSGDPINQGTVVRVCVRPDAEARADQIYMRSVDEFTWTRGALEQPAIIGRNQEANNGLTDLTCTPGDAMCRFETILFAAFYTSLGTVSGSGVASMQFGSTDRSQGRRLRSGAVDEARDLQEEEAAAAAEFDLDFDVAQATFESTSDAARAFGGMLMGSLMAAVALIM